MSTNNNLLITANKLYYWVKKKKNLFKWNKLYLLNDINLEIRQGDCISIFGKNGAGKTTLLEVLFGFRERYEGKLEYHPLFHKASLGFVLQNNRLLNRNIQPLIKTYLKLFNRTQADLDRLIEQLDFAEIKHAKLANQLSNGQRQKLRLLLMMLKDPDFLILDEITTSLDYISRKSILNFLVNLKKSKAITMFIISHNDREIATLADKFYYLHDKTIAEKIDFPDDFDQRIDIISNYLAKESLVEKKAFFHEIY